MKRRAAKTRSAVILPFRKARKRRALPPLERVRHELAVNPWRTICAEAGSEAAAFEALGTISERKLGAFVRRVKLVWEYRVYEQRRNAAREAWSGKPRSERSRRAPRLPSVATHMARPSVRGVKPRRFYELLAVQERGGYLALLRDGRGVRKASPAIETWVLAAFTWLRERGFSEAESFRLCRTFAAMTGAAWPSLRTVVEAIAMSKGARG